MALKPPSPYNFSRPSRCFRQIRSLSSSFPSKGAPHASSVNPAEVSHFNALASSWWDPHGPSRLLHLMNPLRHDFIASCHVSQSEGAPVHRLRYLDVGCGGGIFAESAARLARTHSVTAIDPSAEVLRIAEEHARRDPLLYRTGRLSYLNTGIEGLAVPTGDAEQQRQQQYDVLTLFEVVEHVSYPGPFLASCLPFVRPGGWLVLSTIARTWTSWLTTKVVAEELARLVPRGTHDWAQYLNQDEVAAWFRARAGWGGRAGGAMRTMGCVYVPGLGWRMATGGERWGNYFFGVRRDLDA